MTERKNTMQFEYKTKGTCSQHILFEIEDNKLKNVQFIGGCNGNLKGIGSLVDGMEVDEVITRLEGTTCGMKATSCPDQLAQALKQAKEELNK
jgi:uncharacterized protein (TIGR03905 family)